MGVWLREVAGWVLLAVGLIAFVVCYFLFVLNRQVFETAATAFIGFTVFRGGMQLLKVAMAARAAREVGRPEVPAGPRPIRLPLGGRDRPGRPRESVVPGAARR